MVVWNNFLGFFIMSLYKVSKSYLHNKLFLIRKRRKSAEKEEHDALAKLKEKLDANEKKLSKSEQKACELATD
jgi:hypothetical protein